MQIEPRESHIKQGPFPIRNATYVNPTNFQRDQKVNPLFGKVEDFTMHKQSIFLTSTDNRDRLDETASK